MNLTGRYLRLPVVRKTQQGYYLKAEEGTDILLPASVRSDELKTGEELDVFIYQDSAGRLIAVDRRPYLLAGECGYLLAKENTGFGTFMDWGIPKDLLVPFSEQKVEMIPGKKYLVYVYVDEKSGKLTGTTYVNDFIMNDQIDLKEGDEVNILVTDRTTLGYNVIINNRNTGLIYHNEIFTSVSEGDKRMAFIKSIRPDRKIDVILSRPGYEEISNVSEQILKVMRMNGGYLGINDNSEPEEIYRLLGVSKKSFKKAVGALYREKKINLEEKGIRLL